MMSNAMKPQPASCDVITGLVVDVFEHLIRAEGWCADDEAAMHLLGELGGEAAIKLTRSVMRVRLPDRVLDLLQGNEITREDLMTAAQAARTANLHHNAKHLAIIAESMLHNCCLLVTQMHEVAKRLKSAEARQQVTHAIGHVAAIVHMAVLGARPIIGHAAGSIDQITLAHHQPANKRAAALYRIAETVGAA